MFLPATNNLGTAMVEVEYNGFIGKYSYDSEAGIFHGQVANCRDIITFQSKLASSMKNEMILSLQYHADYCVKIGRPVPTPENIYLYRKDM